MDEKKYLLFGIIFILAAIYCVFRMVTIEVASHTITGTILFTIVGVGFIKKARAR